VAHRFLFSSVLTLILSAWLVSFAEASCNLIPGTEKTFVSRRGIVNRPFAAPGESFEIRLRDCHEDTPGFLPQGDDHVATFLFHADGQSRAVILASDCSAVNTAGCAAQPGIEVDPDVPCSSVTRTTTA